MENKLLAKVDGREVKESDLNSLMRNLGQNASYFQGEEGRKKLLDELIMHELMLSDALEKDLDKDEEFIEAMEGMRKSMLQQYALRKMFDEITASEEEIEAYYEKNNARFKTDEMVSASHILVETEEEANTILKDINEGLAFEEAASQFSSCPSKQAGGALGQFGKGQMVPEFEEVVFTMQVGEISAPVKTQFGYHIIKLTDKTPQGNASLEEVYQEVKNAYYMEKQEELYNSRKAELSNKYTVEII